MHEYSTTGGTWDVTRSGQKSNCGRAIILTSASGLPQIVRFGVAIRSEAFRNDRGAAVPGKNPHNNE